MPDTTWIRNLGATLSLGSMALVARTAGAPPRFVAACPAHAAAISVPGGSLYYEDCGRGPVVVLIHGGNTDRRMWDAEFDGFSQRFRVVRYDVRGFGRSRGRAVPYASHEDLKALLDSLGVARADLVGLSLGGRIAIDFALQHPDRVRRLVLAGPGLSGFPWSNDMASLRDRMRQPVERKQRFQPDRPSRGLIPGKVGRRRYPGCLCRHGTPFDYPPAQLSATLAGFIFPVQYIINSVPPDVSRQPPVTIADISNFILRCPHSAVRGV